MSRRLFDHGGLAVFFLPAEHTGSELPERWIIRVHREVADLDGMVAPDYRTGRQPARWHSPTRARVVARDERIAAVRRIVSPTTAQIFGVHSLTIWHERLIALTSRLTLGSPLPARYVLDQQGRIGAADVNPDYTVRPEPEDTVAVVRRLQAAGP